MAGYQNISTLEPMASGLPPTDIPSILKQRIRWERGGVQSIFNIRVVDTDFWVLLAFWLQSYVLIQFVMADISSDLRTLRWGEI